MSLRLVKCIDLGFIDMEDQLSLPSTYFFSNDDYEGR